MATTHDKILVIDDEVAVRHTLERELQANGYSVSCFATGEEALEFVADASPSVVLIDLLLEDMPGLVVMNRIKEISPSTECIVITGHASQESAIASVNLGAFSYVVKPWDTVQLMVTIRNAIEKSETARALRESEQRYRMLADEAQDSIFMISADLSLKYINSAGAAMFGAEPEEIMGKSISDLFPVDAYESPERHLREVLDAGKEVLVEDTYPFPGGDAHLNIRLVPVRNEREEVVGVHGVSRVITK